MLNPKDKSIRFNVQSLLLIFASFALLSCGGGGDSSPGGTSPVPGSGGNPAGVSPVTPLTSSATQVLPIGGGQSSVTFESGFEGLIEVNTQTVTAVHIDDAVHNVDQTFQLANGTPSLNVVDVQKAQAFEFSCNDGSNVKGTSIFDYITGTVVNNGTVNDQTLSCTSTFLSILATTITDTSSIDELFLDWGSDDDLGNAAQTGLINTDCPQGDEVDFNVVNPFQKSCSGSFLTNYTVTDINGAIHKVSTRITIVVSGNSNGLPEVPKIPQTPEFDICDFITDKDARLGMGCD